MKKTDYIVMVNQDGTHQRVWQGDDGRQYIRTGKTADGWQYRPLEELPCRKFVSYSPKRI